MTNINEASGLKKSSDKNVNNFLFGNSCILIAAIFWGINVSAIKALIPEWMSADGISAVRLIGACVLFWIVSLFIKNDKILKDDWIKLILGGFIGLFGFIYLFVTSLRFANPIDVSIIMTLPPIFVILIGVLFRHQHPSTLEYVGVGVSFIGAFIVIWSGNSGKAGPDNLLGDLIAVASTVCYAVYLVILEGPTNTYKPVTMLRWVFLFGAIPAICLVPGMQHEAILHTTKAVPWIEILFILFCPTFLAYFLVQPAMKRIGSELVSIYQYLVPVFATISAVLMKIDKLQWVQVIAMIVIVAGMIFTNIGKRKRVVGNAVNNNFSKNIANPKNNN
ncbi:MAG: DMT family transporter [Prevotella sp.]|nr:DMT family transporter [Bacteroides sp.]MCM1365866.1 DMT family transporter [Prevotella sp.]